MFKVDDIKKAESRIKTGADFPEFIKTLKSFGIKRNDVYVTNGLSVYFGDDQTEQISPDEYPDLLINEESSPEKLKHALHIHQRGETDFATFCKQAADAGVEKWVVDLENMTCTYLDSEQNELVIEQISEV